MKQEGSVSDDAPGIAFGVGRRGELELLDDEVAVRGVTQQPAQGWKPRLNPGVLRTCRPSVFYLHSNVGSRTGGRMRIPPGAAIPRSQPGTRRTSMSRQVKQQRRGYAQAVLRALARSQRGRPTAQVQRMLRDSLSPLGVRLSPAALHELAADIAAGRPVELP
jgi:hypothetical protein